MSLVVCITQIYCSPPLNHKKNSLFFIIVNDYLCWYNSKETRITAMFRIEENTKTE